ncbi:MAG: tRNA (N(6)-L-threonylcarbamoyladenosine(37)-C(2))-methylthiotransferase MtaB [Clostridiales bacterium]|nr:tRNA (N(6)-L-threonylcarbamoyladenosine(37)-C(2))-methylthiotransferase MtaB [Clostridiales bacterium]
MKIAFHTLGCKVNQYDSEAMLESFERAGYEVVPFDSEADVYGINTCTVTGTGDTKSVKLIRRIHRHHPEAKIIVTGCLAQRDPQRVLLPGVALVIGVQHRAKVVELFEKALETGEPVCAVESLQGIKFEELSVTRHEGKTRATMKIQEGCDRFCTYCVIPYVRGPVRSMPLESVHQEAQRLADAGYREIVVTGIHLASYGRVEKISLLDAIRAVSDVEGVKRIRLGSLEPVVVTDEFVAGLAAMPKVCGHFHLSMQSGSPTVLERMRRRYTPEEYMQAVEKLRGAFPDCAITTDVLTGFPGETEDEARETAEFVERVAFARIHVFPYSPRAGTKAADMPNQVDESIKQARCAELIEIGNRLEECFVKKLTGTVQEVLFERVSEDGWAEGLTGQYVHVRAKAQANELARVKILYTEGGVAVGEVQR